MRRMASSAILATWEGWLTVCHCFAEAVSGVPRYSGTACSKQWHTAVGMADPQHLSSPMLRSLLQTWLQNTAKARLRDVAVEAAKAQLGTPTATPPADEPKSCHLGFVFALGIESGCFEDLLQGMLTVRGGGFAIREAGLRGRRIALILAGPGQHNARRATEILIDGHRPGRVVSAGFTGGLSPSLRRNDILIANRLLNLDGGELPVEVPPGLSAVVEAASRRFLPGHEDHQQRQPTRRDAAFYGGRTSRHAADGRSRNPHAPGSPVALPTYGGPGR